MEASSEQWNGNEQAESGRVLGGRGHAGAALRTRRKRAKRKRGNEEANEQEAHLEVNRAVNRYRERRGRPPYSLSKQVKAKVKGAVSFVGRYEDQLQSLAEQRRCDGIICGQIHTPAEKQVGMVHYLNSGDWVESSTCLAEDRSRKFRVVRYNQFREELECLRGGCRSDAG